MRNDVADAAEVLLARGVHVIQRGLQNAGREHDLVAGGHIAGVDRVGCHRPQVLVDRPALPRDQHLLLRLHHGDDVVKVAAALGCGLEGDALEVVVPLALVRVADLDAERVQLFDGFRLGRVAHPVERADAVLIDVDEIVHHVLDVRLGLLGEVFFRVQAAELVGQVLLDELSG